MSDLEFDILDEMYFMISYAQLAESLSLPASQLNKGLCSLLENDFAGQYHFDDKVGDFVRLQNADQNRLEAYHYLATKEGLLAHNL